MPAISGLRSLYDKVGPLIYVGRMFDKIRLHERGDLPVDFHAALGSGLDARACNFFGVDYEDVKAQVLTGSTDDELLAWCFEHGISRSEHDCTVWNTFLPKLGWRDDRSDFLAKFRAKLSYADSGAETFFDLIEVDENRPLRSSHV